MFRLRACANHRTGRLQTIWRCARRSAHRRSRYRASCCSHRARRSAVGPMWSRRLIRWRPDAGVRCHPDSPGLSSRDCTANNAAAEPWPAGTALAVGKDFAHQRERRRPGGSDLPYDARKIEAQLGIVFAGELLHALVVGEARQVQEFEAAVARGEQRALEQHGTDAVALPWLLDREGGLGLTCHGRSDRPQLRCAAQRVVDEETMDERIDAE